MKKVLCAVALAALVTPVANVNAVNLYDKDGFKFDVKGDWEIQLRQDVGADQDVDMVFDDLELKNRAEYSLGNDMVAFGELDFGFKKAGNDSERDTGHIEEAYLGLSVGATSVLFGKTDGAGDRFGVADAKENPVADDVFDAFGATGGDDLILVETKIGDMVTLVADYELKADSSDTDNNGEFYTLYAEGEFVGLTVGAAFQHYEPADELVEANPGMGIMVPTVKKVDDFNMYGVSLSYDAGVVAVGADYSIKEDSDTDSDEVKIANFVVSAPVGESVSFVAGYVMADSDGDDAKGWYVNATYTLPMQENVSFFAEVEDNDEDDTDMGFLVGMALKF